jgi:UMF1 family MFS transporter
MIPGYSAREQRAWCWYDCANSAFTTTVVSLFLGPYLTSLARDAAGAGVTVSVAGIPIAVPAVWPYAVSLSVFIQVFALPIFGAVADYGRKKREMLAVLTAGGSIATASMFALTGGAWVAGVMLFLFANFCFGAAVVVYNSFLPEIAAPEDRDSVSSRGWAFGYFGGGVLLALNLLLYTNADRIGLTGDLAVRISLASAGVWWALFSIHPLSALRNRGPSRTPPAGEYYITAAVRQLLHTLKGIRRYPDTMLFLAAYLIYNDAIQTVFTMAVQFGSEELRLKMSTLTSAVLLVQFVAFGGAVGFNFLAGAIGAKRAVLIGLGIWCLTLTGIYGWVYTATGFFVAASAIGAVMGGTQALSRSLFSQLIPKGQEAEYFSIYEVSDKGTSWLGPLFFGLGLQVTGSFRVSILSLILFFAAGMLLLARVDVRKGACAVGNEVAAG